MNTKVTELLNRSGLSWIISTSGKYPHAIAVNFKSITEKGELAIADVFMKETIKNIADTGIASVTVFDPASLESYEIRGKAAYLTDGKLVEGYKAIVSEAFNGNMTAKGVIAITPEEIKDLTPGPNADHLL